MEKTSIALIYVVTITVLAVLLGYLAQSKRKHVIDLTALLILGILLNSVFMVSLFTDEYLILKLVYTFVLIIESWMLFLFLRYAHARNNFWQKYKDVCRGAGMVLIVADNLLLIMNVFRENLFKFEIVDAKTGVYVSAEWSAFFIGHWLGCLVVAVLISVIMLKKTFMVASIYRGRYLFGSSIFIVGLALDFVARILSNNMNMWSVSLFSFGSLCYYFMYFIYPWHRSVQMKNYAINNMSEPVLMFDYNNNLQVFNEAAKKMFGVSAYYPMDKYIKENELYYAVEEHGKHPSKKSEFVRTQIIESRTYLIHGQELWDEKKKFVGTLILYTDITGQEKLKNEATLYATRDQLTGLWNRDYFFEMVGKTIRENPDEEFLMVASDIYQFKMFNEILGSSAGDDLLLAIAQGYRERCKRLWVFSRVSADRYGLLMPKSDFREEKFLEFVRNVFNRKHYELKVHCYMGVYDITDRSISPESMYNRAYMALESIKGNFQKEIAYYHEEILNKRIFETTTLDELDRALLNDEFVIYLQPQIDIQNMQVVSAEALIRWNKPGRGLVSPAEFIPIFENNGMIAKLDYHVWELACRQLLFWKNEGYPERSVSVNISAKDFYLADLYESLVGLVERYNINPANLKLEITETAFVLDVQKQMELVRRLQAYGFIIEIDDFGSGYSSLNSLKDIHVDVLKMDMKFFEKTDETDRAEKIVRSVVTLANELGMPVIAEGVETEADLELLKRVGCQIVQGYYFSKPIPVMEYEQFLNKYPYGNMDKIIEKVRLGD